MSLNSIKLIPTYCVWWGTISLHYFVFLDFCLDYLLKYWDILIA